MAHFGDKNKSIGEQKWFGLFLRKSKMKLKKNGENGSIKLNVIMPSVKGYFGKKCVMIRGSIVKRGNLIGDEEWNDISKIKRRDYIILYKLKISRYTIFTGFG